jgi:pectate lyase
MMLRRFAPLALAALGALSLNGCGGGSEGTGSGTGGAGGTTGVAGTTGSAGTTGARGGTTGSAGTTATGGRGGTTGTGGAPPASSLCTWPTASSTVQVNATLTVGGNYDGTMRRFVGAGPLAGTGQQEGQDPIFRLLDGTVMSNVIIGSPGADGIHCDGTCTLRNVWWEDVGEDAATLDGTSASQTMTIENGGAQKASDKVFQHNGPGTMIIRNFCVQDFGKVYRSCGNCRTQYARNVRLQNLMVVPSSGSDGLVGVNSNYNDTATFSAITIRAATNSLTICQRYTGNNTGAEPTSSGSGADGTVCKYSASDIIWMP